MTAFSALTEEVLESCAGCPEPLIERNIRNSVITLCERAHLLRKTLDPITIEAGVPSYVLIPPTNRIIVDVKWATIGEGPKMEPASEDLLDLWWQEQSIGSFRFDNTTSEENPMGQDWRGYTQSTPQTFFIECDDSSYKVRLVGIPTETIADTLRCRVILTPTRESTEVDDWLMEDYHSALINGAKARCLLIPKTKWFEPQLGAMFTGMFDDAVEKARMKASRDFIRDDESVGHVKAWV